MLGIFKKSSPEELRKAELFGQIVGSDPIANRYSYRKNGRYEIIFNGKMEDLMHPENQSLFNVLAHVWLIIWGNDHAELHVGATHAIGFRLTLKTADLYTGHKFENHEERVEHLLSMVGIER